MKRKNKENSSSEPNKSKPYAFRNFRKEIKRVKWPTDKKHYLYFFLVFVFIIFLISFFALVSLGATKLFEVMGVK